MMLSEMPAGKLECAQRPAQREPPLPHQDTQAGTIGAYQLVIVGKGHKLRPNKSLSP